MKSDFMFIIIDILIIIIGIVFIIWVIKTNLKKWKEKKIIREYAAMSVRYPIGLGMWLHKMNIRRVEDCFIHYKELKRSNFNPTNGKYHNSIFDSYRIRVLGVGLTIMRHAVEQKSYIADLNFRSCYEYEDLKKKYYNGISEISHFPDVSQSSVLEANDFIKIYSLINKDSIIAQHKKVTVLEPFDDLYKLYPLGVLEWLDEARIMKNPFRFTLSSLSYSDKEKVVNADADFKEIEQMVNRKLDKIKRQYPKGIASNVSDIEKIQIVGNPEIAKQKHYERLIEEYDKGNLQWKKDQEEFSQDCIGLCEKKLPGYGRYYYYVPFIEIPDKEIDRSKPYYINGQKTPYELKDSHGNPKKSSIEVWQFFGSAYCKNSDSDSKYFPNNESKDLPKFKNGSLGYQNCVYEEISSFLHKIKELYSDLFIVFIFHKEGWDKRTLTNQFVNLVTMLDADEIGFEGNHNVDILYDAKSLEEIPSITDSEHFVIIDFATENQQLISNCDILIKAFEGKIRPKIVYLSLLKCYDSEEVKEIIKDSREKAETLERAHKAFEEGVKNWPELYGGLRYKYLLNYYPTTCDFEATDEEWGNRWLVWDFKNTPGKTKASEHEKALNDLLPRFQKLLNESFGKDNLKYLTLVCIPGSSKEKTELRYKEFSERLCKLTGMEDSYNYVTVTKDAVAKHLGGSGQNEVKVDKNFFKGKYVLLFDDIITRGVSMRRFKTVMMDAGAHVVAGMSIGMTKHERES